MDPEKDLQRFYYNQKKEVVKKKKELSNIKDLTFF